MKILTAVTIVIAVLAAATTVSAQPERAKSDIPQCEVAKDVSLAGKVILRVRTPGTEESCQARADRINERLVELLSGPVRKWEIGVKMKNGEWAVYADNELIITADADSAALNGTNSGELANMWASNLRGVIYAALPWGYSPQADEYKRKMELQASK